MVHGIDVVWVGLGCDQPGGGERYTESIVAQIKNWRTRECVDVGDDRCRSRLHRLSVSGKTRSARLGIRLLRLQTGIYV